MLKRSDHNASRLVPPWLTPRSLQNLSYAKLTQLPVKSWLLRCVCWLTVAQWDGKPRDALIPFTGVRIFFAIARQLRRMFGARLANELATDRDRFEVGV